MCAFPWPTAGKVEFVETREHRQFNGMVRRSRRDGFVHFTTSFANEARAEGQTPLSLAKSRSETGVAFDRFDVAIPTLHRRFEFVERDVFTTTHEGFHG